MNRVRAFFIEEAAECLRTARLGLDASDTTGVLSAVRRLRGSAQMARFGEIAEVAGSLESRLRGEADAGRWAEESTREHLDRLDDLVRAVRRGTADQDPEDEDPQEGHGTDPGGEDRMEGAGREETAVVEIEELEYRGRAALERALQLRESIEDAVVAERPVGPLLDELFALVRQGMR